MAGPLNGLRVLDLSRILAGPWSMQNLGDLGADVVKVERPGAGDDSRHWGPPWLRDADGRITPESTYYLSANRNKRSVAIDLSRPEGQRLVRDLARRCDIVIENYKVGTMGRYGLDYESLRAVQPRIIYLSLTGFGQDGPYAEHLGYDYLFQGIGGLMSVTGEADGKPGAGPQKIGVPLVDLFTGMYSTVAILAALHHRERTGEGQYIDLSLFDTVLALGAGALSNYWNGGRVPRRTGNASSAITPYDVFKCSDGDLVIASANEGQFHALARAIGRPQLSADPRFGSNEARMAHHAELMGEIGPVLASQTRAHWEQVFHEAGVPAGSINDYPTAAAHPQAVHHGSRVELDHPFGVKVSGVASPMRFSRTPVEYRRPPPLLGEHTREVLVDELGLPPAEYERLEAAGVVGPKGAKREAKGAGKGEAKGRAKAA